MYRGVSEGSAGRAARMARSLAMMRGNAPGWEAGRWALRVVASCALLGVAGGLCSHGTVPKPPPNSEWDPARSDVKCTTEVCVDKELYVPGGQCPGDSGDGQRTVCPSTGECDDSMFGDDDGSECFCRTCCTMMSAEWDCKWSWATGQAMREPGNLHRGEKCTATCQRGYTPKDPRTPSAEFTCVDSPWRLEPPANSTFECVEDTTPKCGTAPPCEGAGCEWATHHPCVRLGTIDSTCWAQCRAGYSPEKGLPGTVQYKCKESQTTGEWEWAVAGGGEPLECLRKCSDSPPLLHQNWRTEGTADLAFCGHPPYTQQTCKPECQRGYHLAEGMSPLCDTDDSDCPSWGTPTRMECCDCFKKMCGVERVQGYKQCTDCLRSHAKACLETGFCTDNDQDSWCAQPITNPDDVGWYTCDDGEWVRRSADTECKCTPNQCAATEENEVVPGATGCPARSYSSNQTISGCELRCLGGYEKIHGSGTYRCSSNGEFVPTTNTLVCEAACKRSLPVAHVDPEGCKGRDGRTLPIVSEECTAQCAEGWVESRGTYQYRCVPGKSTGTAHWVPTSGTGIFAFQCVLSKDAKPCTAQTPAKNLHFKVTEKGPCNHTLPGEKCEAECDDSYEPDGGDPFYICDAAGRWVPKSFDRLLCQPAATQSWTDWTKVADWIASHTQIAVPAGVGALCLLCTVWRLGLYPDCLLDRLCPRPGHKPASVLRQSFLGGSHKMAATRLAERDVQARWLLAERLAVVSDDEEGDVEQQQPQPQPQPEPQLQPETEAESRVTSSSTSSTTTSTTSTTTTNSSKSASRRRVPKAALDKGPLPVMFTNDHVRELQPRTWQQTPLGAGTYGIVYKATWRGRGVAVKVLKLPERGQVASSSAEEVLKTKVQNVMDDFVTEVEICCDLKHRNLARLLGYAEQPKLMMVQELLQFSVDTALYINMWQPTFEQVLKSALDIARGMNYLHTAFKMQSSNHTQPIIHRDLKTPNLLLATNPLVGEPVLMKITDFGLSRDKGMGATFNQTVAMTGCGSVLWMAPEILLGRRYNEKVDVYSYAMCLLELVDRQLPWSGVAMPASVPSRVTKSERPFKQLVNLQQGTAAQCELRDLIYKCWHPKPQNRPAFAEVKVELKRLRELHRQGDDGAAVLSADKGKGDTAAQGARSAEALGNSRPASPGMPTLVEGAE